MTVFQASSYKKGFADGMAHAASRQSVSKALLDEIGNAAVVQQQIGQGEYEVGNVAKSEWHKGKAAGMREVLAMIVHSSNYINMQDPGSA